MVMQVQPRVIIYINFEELESLMLHAKFQDIGLLVVEKEIFEGFYHIIWAWQPSWPCNLDHLYNFSFPLLMKAPHEIWLWWAIGFREEDF